MAYIKTSSPEIRVGLDSISKPKKMSMMNVASIKPKSPKNAEVTMPKNKKIILKRKNK